MESCFLGAFTPVTENLVIKHIYIKRFKGSRHVMKEIRKFRKG